MTLTATLDKGTYSPGETMTLTVATVPTDRARVGHITADVDVPGFGVGTVDGPIAFAPVPVEIADPSTTWSAGKDSGTNAVFTAPAPAKEGAVNVTVGSQFVKVTYGVQQGVPVGTLTPQKATPSLTIGNKVGTFALPASTVTCTDFAEAAGYAGYWFMATNASGVTGAGAGKTMLTMKPNSSTKAATANAVPAGGSILYNLVRVGGDYASNPVLRALTLQGTPQGHNYNGLMLYKTTNALLEDIEVTGIPGSADFPPGETFSVNAWNSPSTVLRRLNLHDSGGSLLGVNKTDGILVEDSSFTGSTAAYGAAVWFGTDATFRRCVFTGNKSGPINHEQLNGQVLHDTCTYKRGAAPFHLQFDNNRGSAAVRIIDPVYDGEKLIVRLHKTYDGQPCKQLASDIHLIVAGVERPDLLQIIN